MTKENTSARDAYLTYAKRQPGMDHARYPWSAAPLKPRIRWPGDALVALWIVVCVEHFRSDWIPPFTPDGAPPQPYFDFREWSLRDYGLRVGLFRVLDVCRKYGIPVTAAVNSDVCVRAPRVIEELNAREAEIIGHGVSSMAVHTEALGFDEEQKLIRESLGTLRRASGQRVTGWLSPSGSESSRTPDLLAACGVEYLCDWVNDEVPYEFSTEHGTLYALPYSWEINDLTIIDRRHQTSWDFAEQVVEQYRRLVAYATTEGGRVMCIGLHPWLIGQPHRIVWLDRALAEIARHRTPWPTTGSGLVAAARNADRRDDRAGHGRPRRGRRQSAD
jgi:allantoinase